MILTPYARLTSPLRRTFSCFAYSYSQRQLSMPANTHVKVPKGTRDWFGSDVALREHIFDTISGIFKRHNASPLETPVFELRDILTGKYGEDSKLIYNLEDQGGEICSLRYDLTVPFARWAAMNQSITQVKRYQIAKVYRRDQPAVARGRMREFHQCDFDIMGTFDTMIPDAEVVKIIAEVTEALGLDVTIKINHRKILDALFTVAGVPDDKIRTISASVDKADKTPWAEVEKEMAEKGLSEEVISRLREYIQHNGSIHSILELLKSNPTIAANENIKTGIAEMTLLASYLEALGVKEDKILLDLTLARGLDYYTGLIYEVICRGDTPGSDSGPIGSIAGGGRYDKLIGMFSRRDAPCVGVSFGVERIYAILKAREAGKKLTGQSSVYIMAFGGKDFDGGLLERLNIASQLWSAGISAEFTAKVKPKLPQQFKAAEAEDVPLAIILGQDELASGKVKIKQMGLPDGHPEKDGLLIAKSDVVAEVQKRLKELEVQKQLGGLSV